MDNMNLENDLCMSGMTLRYLLENRDLLSVPSRARSMGKEDRVNTDIYTDVASAFIGQNIWDKTLQDFKSDYIDLDTLLGNTNQNEIQQKILECANSNKEQNVPQLMQLETVLETATAQLRALPACNSSPLEANPQSPPPVETRLQEQSKGAISDSFSVDCKFSPTDLALATQPGHKNYDPTSKVFPVDELKPQPIMKKSRKHFVPDSLKDDKYWARRRKNNIAAKRSREARRLKENQIVLRASYLEKENNSLKEDVMRLKAENDLLKNQLKEFQQS